MSYRQSEQMKMTSLSTQRGLGQWWMVLTIGIMVGFIFGFILFLSRLPDEHYTLVETERGIEQIETTEADQYGFYDRLSDQRSTVPNAKANELPAFTRDRSTGNYGAGENERPTAVAIAPELLIGDDVRPVEIAAALPAGGSNGSASGSTSRPATGPAIGTGTVVVQQPTTIRKDPDRPSTSYYLQAGAFAQGSDAQRLRAKLNQSGMDAFIKKVAVNGKQWHRVRIGPFYDSRSLNTAQTRLGRSGISYLVIKVQS